MLLEYEAMVSNLEATLREIEKFCGLPENTIPGESSMKKLGGARYARMITVAAMLWKLPARQAWRDGASVAAWRKWFTSSPA